MRLFVALRHRGAFNASSREKTLRIVGQTATPSEVRGPIAVAREVLLRMLRAEAQQRRGIYDVARKS